MIRFYELVCSSQKPINATEVNSRKMKLEGNAVCIGNYQKCIQNFN
jgi:hypothetical protein